MIEFACVRCGSPIHAYDSYAGRTVRCSCGHLNVCPRLIVSPGELDSIADPPAVPAPGPSARRVTWPAKAVVALLLVAFGVVIGLALSGRLSPASLVVGQAPWKSEAPATGQEWGRPAKPTPAPSDVRPLARSEEPPRPEASERPKASPAPGPAAVAPSPEPIVAAPAIPRSLPNGTEWGQAPADGLGILEIDNGTSQDAVAALFGVSVGEDVAERAIYIRAGDKATMQHVRAGTYDLRFCHGQDWDEELKSFTFSLSFSEFASPMEFTETEKPDRVLFDKHRVTLHRVVNGNARTRAISSRKFDLRGLVRLRPDTTRQDPGAGVRVP